jgi:DNA-binding winged helix-turn-helix (wHTH) protein
MLLRFAACTFDAERRELRREGRAVPLSPRAYALLALLLDERPRPVPHDRLRDALWPDTAVGYNSLAQVVSEVRRAIGEPAGSGRTIRTVPRVGYAFAAPVTEAGGFGARRFAGSFVGREREHLVPEGESLVGRAETCDVRLHADGVSREHARLVAREGRVYLEDAGSKNGTWVNDARLAGRVELRDGDAVRFGSLRVVFRASSGRSSTRTERHG